MKAEELQAIVAKGETLAVEFKGEEKAPLSDRELVEAVVCLANRSGNEPGWLLIGVEDDGRITGARFRHEANQTDPARLTALLSSRTRPAIAIRVSIIPIAGVEIIAVEVPVAYRPVGTADGRYLRRAISGDGRPACVPFHFHEMQAHQADRGLLDYSALAIDIATWGDLDPLEFARFRRSIRERRGRGDEALLDLTDLELAKALGAVETQGQTTAVKVLGLLLFGKEEALRRFIPTHEVAFQVLQGANVEANDFYRWPLLRVIEEIEGRFRAMIRERELMVGVLRVGIPDYPPIALREAVANALIHRDYTRLGAVHIQWHSAHIEISNPGGFPEGVQLNNLLVVAPRPRNPLLADAFKRAGIVERTARGVDTIFYEQIRNGRPAPSYERSNESGVTLVLPGGEANLALVRLMVKESQNGHIFSLDELLILNGLLQERSLATNEAARLIQKSESEARTVLNRLIEAGLAEGRGERKSSTWRLSAATSLRLGEKADSIQQEDFEPLQQEQMVLQYVTSHGSISRQETAKLGHLSGPQAYRLLNRLATKGILAQVGTKGRGVRYEKGTKD